MIDKIKVHVGRHKVAYSVGTVVVIAGITCIIMRDHRLFCGRITDQRSVADGLPTNTQIIMDSIFIGGDNHGKVINNHIPRGLSYIVSQDGTNNWWISQADYAREREVSQDVVSKHITKGRSLPNGESLTRLGVAT